MKWLFGWLYGPIGTMLSWFSSLFGGSYAFALLLYALLFKIVFLPFSIKQQKNQIKMAKLTPQLELIKAKYAGRTDAPTKQKMQQEIMEFQQKEGYNPLSGCLPMLLQFPIIIFLYDIIGLKKNTIETVLDNSEISDYFNQFDASQNPGLRHIEIPTPKPSFDLFRRTKKQQKEINIFTFVDWFTEEDEDNFI